MFSNFAVISQVFEFCSDMSEDFHLPDSSFLWQSLQTTTRNKYQLELVLQYFINSFAQETKPFLWNWRYKRTTKPQS
jgi:hypothetical protein